MADLTKTISNPVAAVMGTLAPTIVVTSKTVVIAAPVNVTPSIMGYNLVPRNLLTFTENDPSNVMVVTDTTSTSTMPNTTGIKHRLYQDNGTNVLANFTFNVDVNVQSMGGGFKYVFPLEFGNDSNPGTGDWTGAALGFFPYENGGSTHGWYLAAATSPYNSAGRANGTPEYFTFTKVGTTVSLYRYADSARTSLTFTLTSTDTSTYRYLFVNRDFNYWVSGTYTCVVSNVSGTDSGYFKVLLANPVTITPTTINVTAAVPTTTFTPTYYDSDWVWNNGTPQAIAHTYVDFRKNAVQGGYRRNPTPTINWTFKWKQFSGKTAGYDTRLGLAEAIPVYTPPSWWIPFGILTRIYYGNNGSNGFYFDSLLINGSVEATTNTLGVSSAGFPFDVNSWHSLVRSGTSLIWYVYADETRTDLRYTLSLTINATRLYPYLYHLAVGPNTNWVVYDSRMEYAHQYPKVSQLPDTQNVITAVVTSVSQVKSLPTVVNITPATESPTVEILAGDTSVSPDVVLATVETLSPTIDVMFRAVFPCA